MTPLAHALRTALFDFVWQGLLLAFLLWVVLVLLRNRSARARYAAGTLTLAAMFLLPAVTACLVYTSSAGWHPVSGWVAADLQAVRAAASVTGLPSWDWAGWLRRWSLPLWALGVLACSTRLVWSAWRISGLRRRSTEPEAAVLALAARLMERMRLLRPVSVRITDAADCPSVVGWIRPVVLLPAATLLGLTPQQLEAVLAHELAHILRYDYFVNMLQTIVETLLFYHPAVWWVSARIRRERELCCDDLAVAVCGDALCYARALTRLEKLRLSAPGMALGSTGGPLLDRIRRIVGEPAQAHAPSKITGILALSLGLVALAVHLPWARGQQAAAPVPPAAAGTAVADDPGVKVNLGGATVIDREPVSYPAEALEKKVRGTVVVQASVDADGAVSDARVLSGPPALRKAALQSVLQWQFGRDAAGETRQVRIVFEPPANGREGVPDGVGEGIAAGIAGGIGQGVSRGVGGGIGEGVSEGVEALAQDLEQSQRARRDQVEEVEEQVRKLIREKEDAIVKSQRAQELKAELLASESQMAALRGTDAAARAGMQATLAQLEALRKDRSLQNNMQTLADALVEKDALEQSRAAVEMAANQASQLAALESRLQELRNSARNLRLVIPDCRLKSITVEGMSQRQRERLMAALPVHVGDRLNEDFVEKIEAAVKQFDQDLRLSFEIHGHDAEIRIAAPERHL